MTSLLRAEEHAMLNGFVQSPAPALFTNNIRGPVGPCTEHQRSTPTTISIVTTTTSTSTNTTPSTTITLLARRGNDSDNNANGTKCFHTFVASSTVILSSLVLQLKVEPSVHLHRSKVEPFVHLQIATSTTT